MRWLAFLSLLMLTGLPPIVQAWADSGRVRPYTIVNGREIPNSITGQPGDAEAGRKLYFDRELTGCSGCHGSPGGPGAQPDADRSEAPSLAGIATRRTEGAIRLWLVAPEVLNADTAMPAYYGAGQRTDPTDPRFGEPRLTAIEIEDLVAYLLRQTTSQ